MFENKILLKKLVALAALILVAVLSITVVSKYATSPEVHAATIEELDNKKMQVLGLTTSVTLASTALSAIPGDAATPIAEQLSELTTPLFIIICTLYLEKFLLTTLGYLSFSWLIPIACILVGIYIFCEHENFKITAIKLAAKLAIFAIAIYFIIPISVKVTNMIEATFDESISRTFETIDEISEEAEKSAEEEDTSGFLDFLSGIGEKATELTENAKNALSIFIDAIAVLIITTCCIPITVILFFTWIIKIIFGVNIDISKAKKLLPHKSIIE